MNNQTSCLEHETVLHNVFAWNLGFNCRATPKQIILEITGFLYVLNVEE